MSVEWNTVWKTVIEAALSIKLVLALAFLGLLSFLVLELSLSGLLRASADMKHCNMRWLKMLKNRYENYHVMHVRINHVEAFVERFFSRKRVLGLKISAWVTIFRLSAWGCAITGAASALLASQMGRDLREVMTAYLTGITAAGSLFFLGTFLRVEEKRDLVRTNIYDYLENDLANRLEGRMSEERLSDQSVESGRKPGQAKEGQEQTSTRISRKPGQTGAGQVQEPAGTTRKQELTRIARKQESTGTNRRQESATKKKKAEPDDQPGAMTCPDLLQKEASAASYAGMSAREQDSLRESSSRTAGTARNGFQMSHPAVTAEEEKLLEDVFEDYLN